MPWVKFDDQFDDDPDIDMMSDSAIALHVCGITWSSRNLTDGFIPRSRVPKLPGGNTDAITELTSGEKPWWIVVDGGYQIRSFLKYNPSKERVEADREATARRQAELRARRRQGKGGDDGVNDPVDDEGSNAVRGDVTDGVTDGVTSPVSPSRVPVSRIPYPVSPYPGSRNPNPEGEISARGGKSGDPGCWERFCADFPGENRPGESALQVFLALPPKDQVLAADGAGEYRRFVEVEEREDRFIARPENWLKNRRWLEKLDPRPPSPKGSSPPGASGIDKPNAAKKGGSMTLEEREQMIADAKRMREAGGIYGN